MYCPKCGAKVDEDSKFCTECGASLGDAAEIIAEIRGKQESEAEPTAAPASARVAQAAGMDQPVSLPQQSVSPQSQPQPDQASKKKEPKAFYIFGIVVGLIAIGLMSWQLFFNKPGGSTATFGQKDAVVCTLETNVTPEDKDGKKLTSYVVELVGENGYSAKAKVTGEGGFPLSTFEDVKPGTYTLKVTNKKSKVEYSVPIKIAKKSEASDASANITVQVSDGKTQDDIGSKRQTPRNEERDSKPESEVNRAAEDAYEGVLNEYREAFKNNDYEDYYDSSKGIPESVEYWTDTTLNSKYPHVYGIAVEADQRQYMETSLDKTRYAYVDLDDDGIEELLVGNGEDFIWAIYRCVDGDAKGIYQGTEIYKCRLCPNNVLCERLIDSSYGGLNIRKVQGSTVDVCESYHWQDASSNPEAEHEIGGAETEPLTADNWTNLQKKIEKLYPADHSVKWIRLDE